MPFHSPEFAFFFLLVALLAYLPAAVLGAPRTLLGFVLAVLSLAFYAFGSPGFLPSLLVLTGFNFLIGQAIARRHGKYLLVTGVVVDLGVLAWFKYSVFAVANVNSVLGLALSRPDVTLPLAVSFFTFQKVAYLVDIWRDDHERWNFGEFFLVVWFFPQLIAGPIVRPHEFIPQWRRLRLTPRRVGANLAIGLNLFFIGMIKKLAIADSAAVYADYVFGGAATVAPQLLPAWIGAIAYAVQIYFDFSGYSDMAIGLARMFGIRLPINFFSPYRAQDIIEFWRRWHITLSRFLRDYLYIPLGGGRRGIVRRYLNLILVMLLGGLWHGANWTFVAWGGLHGLFLVITHGWRVLRVSRCWPCLPGPTANCLTFVAVVFAWVAFRAPDFATVWVMWKSMLGINGVYQPGWVEELKALLLSAVEFSGAGYAGNLGESLLRFSPLLIGLAIALFAPNIYQLMNRTRPALRHSEELPWATDARWRPTAWSGVLLGLALAFAIVLQGRPQAYLYWQF